jgi:hypothetical protein
MILRCGKLRSSPTASARIESASFVRVFWSMSGETTFRHASVRAIRRWAGSILMPATGYTSNKGVPVHQFRPCRRRIHTVCLLPTRTASTQVGTPCLVTTPRISSEKSKLLCIFPVGGVLEEQARRRPGGSCADPETTRPRTFDAVPHAPPHPLGRRPTGQAPEAMH